MNKESLKEALKVCNEAINNLNINTLDKMELIINLYNFLDENKYEKNIKILRKVKYEGIL